jgi:hypothetical protein
MFDIKEFCVKGIQMFFYKYSARVRDTVVKELIKRIFQ